MTTFRVFVMVWIWQCWYSMFGLGGIDLLCCCCCCKVNSGFATANTQFFYYFYYYYYFILYFRYNTLLSTLTNLTDSRSLNGTIVYFVSVATLLPTHVISKYSHKITFCMSILAWVLQFWWRVIVKHIDWAVGLKSKSTVICVKYSVITVLLMHNV